MLALLGGATLLSFVPRLLVDDEAPQWAVIYVDGREWRRLEAGGPRRRIEVAAAEGHGSVVEVEEGRVRFASSDCPDQICVQQGWIGHVGVSALCLPNRVEIRVEGAGEGDDVDAFSY